VEPDWVAPVALVVSVVSVALVVSVSHLCIGEECLHNPHSRSPKSDRKYTHQDEGHLHRFSVEPEVMEGLVEMAALEVMEGLAEMVEPEVTVASGPLECRLEVHRRRNCLPRIDTSARKGTHQRMEANHMVLQAATA